MFENSLGLFRLPSEDQTLAQACLHGNGSTAIPAQLVLAKAGSSRKS
ncbi:MAG: hypothetical protein OXJ52_09745 [Oligoflexia bacterium]|nr:hypothetical protein [Oligoflexia bacterium]